MIELIVQTVFFLAMIALAIFSIAMFYALFRFGKSKTLVLIVSTVYVIVMLSLFVAATINLNKISFDILQ